MRSESLLVGARQQVASDSVISMPAHSMTAPVTSSSLIGPTCQPSSCSAAARGVGTGVAGNVN